MLKKRTINKLASIAAIAIIALAQHLWRNSGVGETLGLVNSGSSSALSTAFEQEQSDVQVQGEGEVVNILPDDNDGSRHQRFILRLESGQTVLIAHNIDLAPRIDSLSEGNLVEFYGEYEWNSRGGVVHWTHHDPRGSHVDGWLKHDGQTYQ